MFGCWSVRLAAGLALGLVGCKHRDSNTSPANPLTPPFLSKSASIEAPAQKPEVKEVGLREFFRKSTPEDKVIEPMKPSTLTSFGDLRLTRATANDRPAEERHVHLAEARKYYDKALTADPKYVPALIGMAKIHAMTGNPDSALTILRQAAALEPNNTLVYFETAMLLEKLNDHDGAIADLRKALEIEPENTAYRKLIAFCMLRGQRYEEGFRTLVGLTGEVEARFVLARMMFEHGRDEDCKQQCRLILAVEPTHTNAAKMLYDLGEVPRTNSVPGTLPQSLQAQGAPVNHGPIRQTSYDGPKLPPPTITTLSSRDMLPANVQIDPPLSSQPIRPPTNTATTPIPPLPGVAPLSGPPPVVATNVEVPLPK